MAIAPSVGDGQPPWFTVYTPDQRKQRMNRLAAVLGLLLLSACSTDKYMTMPDGSRPLLYPHHTVLAWPLVDGAHQAPSGRARIYIDETARFDKGVQLGDGVRIGANTYFGEDVVLMPNVIVGEETRLDNDVIVQADVKVGNRVTIGNDTKIGAASVIEDGALTGNWVIIGKRVIVGAQAKVGAASVISDGTSIPRSEVIASGSRL
jgi:UDP-3-O-[3-hydroxymyristoyl] glucosamine N-acyltransferase